MVDANQRLTTVHEVVAALGGPTATGRCFSVGPSAVCNWLTADRFPQRLHMQIYAELKRRDLDFAGDLFGINETEFCGVEQRH